MNLSYSVTSQSALVIEGGAMRSVFSAGLLDGFLARQFNPFDFYIGVSAGAYNLATYLAGRPGLSLHIYTNIATNKHFISYPRFLHGGHLLDLDWLAKAITAEFVLDPARVIQQGKPLYICVTDVSTGQAVYVSASPETLESVIKASMALPLIYRGFPTLNGSSMTDGGVADGIPVAEAIRLGARQIMVIRSRHKNYVKRDTYWHRLIRWKLRNYPALTQTMRERITRFENTLQLIRNPPQDVKILEICPPAEFNIGRFCRNRNLLKQGYENGFNRAGESIREWQSIICNSSQAL